MDLALEYSFFSSQICSVVFFRECYLDILAFASAYADQLFFESRNECSGAQLQRLSFCSAAFELFIADPSFIVDEHHVSILSRSVDRYHSGVLSCHALDFVFNIFVCHFRLHCFDLNTLIILHFDFRIACYFDGDRKALALLQFAEVCLRVVDNIQIQFIQCQRIMKREELVDGIFKEYGFTILLLDDASWSLTLSETVY